MVGAKIMLENCIIIGVLAVGYGIWRRDLAVFLFGALFGGAWLGLMLAGRKRGWWDKDRYKRSAE